MACGDDIVTTCYLSMYLYSGQGGFNLYHIRGVPECEECTLACPRLLWLGLLGVLEIRGRPPWSVVWVMTWGEHCSANQVTHWVWFGGSPPTYRTSYPPSQQWLPVTHTWPRGHMLYCEGGWLPSQPDPWGMLCTDQRGSLCTGWLLGGLALDWTGPQC